MVSDEMTAQNIVQHDILNNLLYDCEDGLKEFILDHIDEFRFDSIAIHFYNSLSIRYKAMKGIK